MKKISINSLLFFFLTFASFISHAAPKISALESLQKVYGANKSFSAHFEQKLFNKILRREDSSTGTLVFLKPNKIRWEYLKPQKKFFIFNGKTLWIYQEQDKQLMINQCFKEDLLSASLSFLINPQALDKDFLVVQLPGTKSETQLRLTPKKAHPVIGEMVLVLDPKNFHIKKSIIKDRQGNINLFAFTNENLKAVPAAHLFNFTAPAGTATSQIGNCSSSR